MKTTKQEKMKRIIDHFGEIEIPYYYDVDTQEVVELIEKPKAKYFSDGDLPEAPRKTKTRVAIPPKFFRIRYRGIEKISKLTYFYYSKILRLTDNEILNKDSK